MLSIYVYKNDIHTYAHTHIYINIYIYIHMYVFIYNKYTILLNK